MGIYVEILMDLDKQINLGHLLLTDRKCRACGETKNLIDGFYRTRKDRGAVLSSYSYECKECTVKRVTQSKKNNPSQVSWEYPDW
jgi:predicted nucleic acid-binding Zn ribbon protein